MHLDASVYIYLTMFPGIFFLCFKIGDGKYFEIIFNIVEWCLKYQISGMRHVITALIAETTSTSHTDFIGRDLFPEVQH